MVTERSSQRTLKLVAIGTAAGLFSGLFGVGGGTVIVPLLVFWLGYGEREATGTSLAAIVFIAVFAAAAQGVYGNVHVIDGLLIGIPAVGGVLVGTWLQQRMHGRADLAAVRGGAGGLGGRAGGAMKWVMADRRKRRGAWGTVAMTSLVSIGKNADVPGRSTR